MKYRRTSIFHPMQIPFGLTIWSLWFAAMYGSQAVICSIAPPDPDQDVFNWLNASFGVLTLIVVALLLWLGRRSWRLSRKPHELDERQVFVTKVASGIHFIAALATVFVGLQLAFLPPCV
ncbi:hypothetical protein CH92_08670 [Stutzerimonas stutzeri]|uniref:Uncharacterized protein n=1 Tax=Stutzerimonas stutzeri TaxID=316 RepID=W8QY17_STUST|nr:hypothetical protein [Stutzerimonas stutzeri]AHL75179.1 hypothetical protein CH92_08670 [Stutzerimonas stutzeri]MCQ4328275.1 hypothetical protein [Stutzerimonas stutzeri]